MSLLVTVFLVAILIGLFVTHRRGRRRGDAESIRSHRTALEVIEHVAGAETDPTVDHTSAHVKVLAPTSGPVWRRQGNAAGEGEVPKLPTHPIYLRQRDRPHFPQLQEQEPTSPVGPPSGLDPVAARRIAEAIRSRRTAADHMGNVARRLPSLRPRALVTGLAAAAAVVVVAGLAATLASRSGGSAATTRPTPVAASPTTRVRTAPSTVPTTALIATSSTSADATYSVSAPSLTLNLSTQGMCWTEVRDGSADGPVVFEGTLAAATTKAFAAAGTLWVRVGDPGSVRLTVNGSPVDLPATAEPFDVTFAVTA